VIRSLVFVLCFLWLMPALADDVRVVQQHLMDKGYGVGKVDGKFGRQTAGAIQQYQTDWQIPVTGKITGELVARLLRKHPDTKARMQKVDNADCQVWNSHPQPRETITFKLCESSGPADDNGEVVWRWYGRGDWQNATYIGEYRLGKMSGRGVFTYPNGQRYEGEFLDDKRHGQGIHEWPRGNRYEGEWRNDKLHGFGVFLRNDERYAGTWRSGCFSDGKRRTWVDTTKKACGFK
jgi:hypothetical protein